MSVCTYTLGGIGWAIDALCMLRCVLRCVIYSTDCLFIALLVVAVNLYSTQYSGHTASVCNVQYSATLRACVPALPCLPATPALHTRDCGYLNGLEPLEPVEVPEYLNKPPPPSPFKMTGADLRTLAASQYLYPSSPFSLGTRTHNLSSGSQTSHDQSLDVYNIPKEKKTRLTTLHAIVEARGT